MAYKFKPHSRFTLPFCIFPKQIAGVFCNFPKQNTLDFYIFPKIFVEKLLVWVRHYMIKSASIVRNLSKNHTFCTIASILIDTQYRFPANFIRSFCDFQSNYCLPEASIHELYSTLIGGGKTHHFFTNQHIYQFCTQNRFTFVCVLCWDIGYHEYFCLTLLKEDGPYGSYAFFYKRKIRIAAICLGLQNALNISDNRSIYNYYGTNRVIIV